MANKPETRRQRRIKEALKKDFPKSFWIKIWTGPFQVRGFPDLLGCVNGLLFAFEVKEPGKDAEPHQERIMKRIRKAGGIACVIYEPQEALNVVRRALRLSGRSC